ncbi:hypothetical protein AB0H77_21965 [Streptomyces sp. NPDC050844]|uniref:hypothetical protein n=1 Tax=Streptomyces sp. NPDC050844 TaxID=3155790 RepID=UPI0033C58DC0
MAYRKKTKRITVSLKGHDNPEFGEVTAIARGRTLNEYLELMGYIEAADDEKSGVMRQLDRFAESLIEWNIFEEDGVTPTPPTREEFFQLDPDLGLALATEWLEILGGKVDAPLAQSSPAGEPSPEASIPMEPLSEHQPPTAVPA